MEEVEEEMQRKADFLQLARNDSLPVAFKVNRPFLRLVETRSDRMDETRTLEAAAKMTRHKGSSFVRSCATVEGRQLTQSAFFRPDNNCALANFVKAQSLLLLLFLAR